MSGTDQMKFTGIVLAGGQGRRMGGVDKGLQLLGGQPLAQHCVQRLQAQTAGVPGLIALNANRHPEQYARWGCPVWADGIGGYAGPLAGFQTALQHCTAGRQSASPSDFAYLLTVACDTPRFPLDLLARLAQAMQLQDADIAVAGAPETGPDGRTALRSQPVFCLLRTSLAPSLQTFLVAGGRKVDTWTAQHRTIVVAFDQAHDDPLAFFNANTLAELNALENTLPPAL